MGVTATADKPCDAATCDPVVGGGGNITVPPVPVIDPTNPPPGWICDTTNVFTDAVVCIPTDDPPPDPDPLPDPWPIPDGDTCPAPIVQCPPMPPVVVPPVDQGIAQALGGIQAILAGMTGQEGSTGPPAPTCPDPPPVNVTVTAPPASVPKPEPGKSVPAEYKAGPWGPGVNTVWGSPDVCQYTSELIRETERIGRPGAGGGNRVVPSWLSVFDPFNLDRLTNLITVPKNATEALSQVGNAIMAVPAEVLKAGGLIAQKALGAVAPQSVPNPVTAAHYAARIGVANWAERQTGMPLSYLYQSDQYIYQAANPQFLPPQAEVDRMWLTGYISDSTWDCLTAAHGNTLYWHDLVLESKIQRPNLGELFQLFLRKEITEPQLYSRARKVGWADPEEVADLKKLTVQLPTQSDLLRMMVREAADEKVVAKYNYDKDFQEKFVGKLKDWSEAQGVPEEIFRYFWRSHWTIPSNTQLYEMFHRLRPDRAEVQKWNALAARIGEEGAIAQLGPRPPVVTQDDVREALEVNDLAPAWVERAIAISYHPITRTDATRAHAIGSFTDEQLESAMLDNGYNATDAKTLVKYYKEQASRQNANASGAMTTRKVGNYYRQGAMSRWEADAALQPILASDDRRRELLDNIDREVKANQVVTWLKLARIRYIAGEDPAGGWKALIATQVTDPVRAAQIEGQWHMEKTGRLKETSALLLGKWFDRGVIDAPTMLARLTRLGYTADDAARIVATADVDRRRKLAQAAKQAAKEALAEQRRAEAEMKKKLKENCNPPKYCGPDGKPIKVD